VIKYHFEGVKIYTSATITKKLWRMVFRNGKKDKNILIDDF
jgi:hypothetical protein